MTPGVVALAAAVSWQNVTSIRDAAEEAVTQLHPGAQVEAAIDDHIPGRVAMSLPPQI